MTTSAKRDLVIVESPSKARTVGRFLGKNYVVLASMGHVRDLPKDWDVEDIDNNFQAPYVNTKKTLIAEIKKAAKQADSIYLATDPDREGEAISWHLVEAAKLGNSKDLKRVVFHEITDLDLGCSKPPGTIRMVSDDTGYYWSRTGAAWGSLWEGVGMSQMQI